MPTVEASTGVHRKMKITLPFHDDSSLIFAARISSELQLRGHQITLTRVIRDRPDTLSDRQISANLEYRPFVTVAKKDLAANLIDQNAIITCRYAAHSLIPRLLRLKRNRPCFVTFCAGFDFFPHQGFLNRKDFDVIFLTRKDHVQLFRKTYIPSRSQYISYGHPYFITPPQLTRKTSESQILFFAQAISPATHRSRQHIIQLMSQIAEQNPTDKIIIKLRHLQNENRQHTHKELYSYQSLMQEMGPNLPKNLRLSSGKTHDLIKQSRYAVTTTSTAIMDAISAGLPSAVYLDYPDPDQDMLNTPMREAMQKSNLIMTRKEILDLKNQTPSLAWRDLWFRNREELYRDLETAIHNFQNRKTLLPF